MDERKNINAFSKTESMCLKGIAIIMMMFHHCYRSVDRFEDYYVDFEPFTMEFIVNISDYFKICVSIFAFITGYGLYLSLRKRCGSAQEIEEWIYKRLIKTMAGFWLVYILVFVVTQIYAGYPISIYFIKGGVRGCIYALIDFLGLAFFFSTPTLVGTWWYMSAAIVFVILMPIFVKWRSKLGYTTLFLVVMAIPRLMGNGYPGGVSVMSFLTPLIMGMVFAEYDIFDKLKKLRTVKNRMLDEILQFVISTFILVASIIIWWRFARDVVWEYHLGLAAIIAIIYCWKYIIPIPVVKDILRFFGKHSMNIFLVHSFIRYVFFEKFIYGFEQFLLIVTVLFSISLVISIVIEFVKKIIRYDRFINMMMEKFIVLWKGHMRLQEEELYE